MALPQYFDGENLSVHIVVVPRNTNPYEDWLTGVPNPPSIPGFAHFQPEFSLGIVRGTGDFPVLNPLDPDRKPIIQTVPVDPASRKEELIQWVADSFNLPVTDSADKLPDPVPVSRSIKKYLPLSYRKSFNFTQPLHPNAVTDDSYECAIRDKTPLQPFLPREKISWGKVFAQILKQPLLAEACGMIYKVSLKIDPEWFENGGYLFASILNDRYAEAQSTLLEQADGPLVKQYASRIPALEAGVARSVFASVTFPVLYKKNSETVPTVPAAPWDELFQEARNYDDGFAKIVHANQPISGNLLKERQDGFHPQTESGIRLGWDDEQILVWYIRQLTEYPEGGGTGKRADAPLSVIGYHIDVRESSPGSSWESLNEIEVSQVNAMAASFSERSVELPYQVYPNKINGPTGENYWMPMYYAHWLGKSMVTEDADALVIYKNDQPNGALIGEEQKKQVTPNSSLIPVPLTTVLRYGQSYEFRVRLTDLSGGGPKMSQMPLNTAPSPIAFVSFKRYVNPGMLRIAKPAHILEQKGEYFNAMDEEETKFSPDPVISIARPLLEYPAVLFTGKYPDPVTDLKNLVFQENVLKPGLPDPDVHEVYIRVEVKSLRMDNALSQNGSDSYITLYQTKRSFPEDRYVKLEIPIQFIDVPVLNLGEEANPFFMDNLKNQDLDAMDALVLPTGRRIRLTLRGLASSTDDPDEYFGVIAEHPDSDSRYGKTIQLTFYKEPEDEVELIQPHGNVPEIQGLFFRPEEVPTVKKNIISALLKRTSESGVVDVVARLAQALGCEAKGMTILAPKGERLAFGCSARIRHTLAPDGSSITFASKAELQNHWVVALSYAMQRDWTWDCLLNDAFSIGKRYKFRRDGNGEWRDLSETGLVELKHTVSFEALQEDRFGEINRGYSRIVYLDAIEPKNDLKRPDGGLRHPDEVWVEYRITPNFKTNHKSLPAKEPDLLSLPTVLPPSQMPKIKSVGLAFSPYTRSEDYSATEVRRRSLWVEFEEPIENPDDVYFCRMLANAPDQLLASNTAEQMIAPEESPINISPELTRIITPGQSDDLAGLDAMQQMMQASDSDRHFILPLPPGMHPESPELFGFFTYEFRVGHGHFNARKDNLWSTAQGRFGRALRVTGIQHPAPSLLCSLNRDAMRMYVSAPFAKAVMNGKNVTSRPPRTSLWAVAYAQVHQADGLDFRNILLGEKEMKIGVKIRKKKSKEEDRFLALVNESYLPNKVPAKIKSSISISSALVEKGHLIATLKDLHPVGTAIFESQEIADRLKSFGLPEDSPLSILVVEVFGNITNIFDHLQQFRQFEDAAYFDEVMKRLDLSKPPEVNSPEEMRPLSRGLGHFRILRTSPLTKVPFVCCPTCEP